MRCAGGRSWQLSVGDDTSLTAALVVRDAAGIVVPHDGGRAPADVPPPLLDPPPRDDALSTDERAAAGADWLAWYRALLGLTVRDHHDPPPPGVGRAWQRWAQARSAAHDAVGAAPDFAGLATAPLLRRAAVAAFRGPARADRGIAASLPVDRTTWAGQRAIADEIVARRHADPGELHGAVVLLPVAGVWWHLAAPGVVLASGAAYRDDDLGPRLVRTALESSLPSGM
ncbi:hypothetical protein [Puerhibacterium sp. TATVAM-FAB25]|uniref:hypothetical protein n=1 Tax=Puerhibacterium sp. TATVAM-FAB25 TaxID=3093699 RepID=UPI00397A5631